MRYILHVFLLLLSLLSQGQEKRYLNRELMIENDNDAYTLNLTRDSYYSQGLLIRYRHIIDTSAIRKTIRSYTLNHRIYTPKRLWWTQLEELDRPYAGQLSVSASNEYYFKSDAYLKLKGEVGWMGPSIKTAELQYGWHKTFGFQLPLSLIHI